jgi:hypothetical protein
LTAPLKKNGATPENIYVVRNFRVIIINMGYPSDEI